MYNNWSPVNGQHGYSYYSDNQRVSENRGYPYAAAASPTDSYYVHAPVQPPQQSPLPRHQPNPTHDPRFTTVHQTNQTLTALASARRFASGYMQEPPSQYPLSHDPNPRDHSYYDAPQQHFSGNGDSSEPAYGARPVQAPASMSSTPSTGNTNSRTSEGHACSYCGKAFGRPSALKIHLAIHTGERAFICPEAGCHRSFSVRSNMSRHIRNVHQIWPEGNQGDLDSGEEAEERRG